MAFFFPFKMLFITKMSLWLLCKNNNYASIPVTANIVSNYNQKNRFDNNQNNNTPNQFWQP